MPNGKMHCVLPISWCEILAVRESVRGEEYEIAEARAARRVFALAIRGKGCDKDADQTAPHSAFYIICNENLE